MVSTTSWGRSPRTSTSHPGTRHEVSRGLDAGATGCPVSESVDPSSEESAKEGLSWGASTQVRVGQYGATSRICSLSSLILQSVCATRLTGGNAYLQRPRGQLCVTPRLGKKHNMKRLTRTERFSTTMFIGSLSSGADKAKITNKLFWVLKLYLA